jgi:hypothetical protein
MVYLIIIVFYLLPLIICYISVVRYYSKDGIGENESIVVVDILFPLIPLINIFAGIKSLFMKVIKEKQIPNRDFLESPRTNYGPVPIDENGKVSAEWVKKNLFDIKKEKEEIGIKFNFKNKNNDNK